MKYKGGESIGYGQTANKLDITADRVLQEIAKLAFLDPRKFFEDDGSLKRIQDLDDDTAACIARMEVTELFEGSGEKKHVYGLLKKFKIADKGQNLERLGRLFGDASQASINVGIQLVHDCPRPTREEG